mmetsp:Transcript_106652/g.309249  ORF Transcript_106652/g.309249 Transcript_106652/m.309249 type:complete len:873 (-) Transcript_106652:11550-14168(-)
MLGGEGGLQLTASEWCPAWLRNLCALQLPVNDVLTLWDSLFEAWPIDDVAPPLLTAVVAAGAVGSRDKLMSCSNAAEAMAAVLSPGVPLVSGPYTEDGVENLLQLARCILDPNHYTSGQEAMSTVTFQEGPLGIVLGQVAGLGLCVRKFQSGSEGQVMQAEATGQIQVHDVVVAINGVQVSENFTPAMLAGVLKKVGRPVCVAFSRVPGASAAAEAAVATAAGGRSAPPPPPRRNLSPPPPPTRPTDGAEAPPFPSSDMTAYGARDDYNRSPSGSTASLTDPMMPRDGSTGSAAGSGLSSRGSITHAGDGFGLPLVPGERYEPPGIEVDMATWQRSRSCDGGPLQRAWIKGQLFVSNYRVFFHAQHKQPWPDWAMPVHSLLRVETDNQKNTKSQTVRSLTLQCKDGQVRRFSMVQTDGSSQAGDIFHSFLRKVYQWAYCNEEEFARRHCEAWTTVLTTGSMLEPPPQHQIRFDLQGEFERMGLATYQADLRLVRQTDLLLCQTYPIELLIPACITDNELQASAKYRSKERLPVVTWFDPSTGCSIARCSQPMVGMNSKRCVEDERLVLALAALTNRPLRNGTHRYCIMDARSKVATQGNRLMGKGVEQTKYYPGTELTYLNIGNIHAARESCESMNVLYQPSNLQESVASFAGKLDATGWLGHVLYILKGSNMIVEELVRERVGVLVHCSDGWDRTPQLCTLAQLCVDPYYRTIQGLQVLIEKDWMAYGHKFSDRCAHSTSQPSEERSPIFLLWLDCVWQIMRQFPTVFEFNEDLLLALLDNLYSCRFGTFLSNCFLDREKHLNASTLSIWRWVEQNYARFLNPDYAEYSEGPVIPSVNPKNIKVWEGYFARFDLSQLPFAPGSNNPTVYYD